MSKQTDFNVAYWLSKPPPIRALQDIAIDTTRATMVQNLLNEGYGGIMSEIETHGDDPYWRMLGWQRDGYTWRPNALQNPISVAPGLNDQHDAPYDPNNPPVGSIKVSTDPKDFPPFDPPTPAPPVVITDSPVGASLGHDNWYASKSWDHYPEGAITGQGGLPDDSRGTFTKTAIPSLFYQAYVWVLASGGK